MKRGRARDCCTKVMLAPSSLFFLLRFLVKKTKKQKTMPRRHPSSQPALDRPRLIPHAGLPGLDGTTRFAYSMEAVGAARDAFKLLPLLPTPLSASSSSPSGAVTVAAAGVGALGRGEAAAGGATALAGGTSGVQVCFVAFFFLSFLRSSPLFFLLFRPRPLSLNLSASRPRKKIRLFFLRARPRAGPRPRARTPRLRPRAMGRSEERENGRG